MSRKKKVQAGAETAPAVVPSEDEPKESSVAGLVLGSAYEGAEILEFLQTHTNGDRLCKMSDGTTKFIPKQFFGQEVE